MSDLDIIHQIERKIGEKLNKVKQTEANRRGYSIDVDNRISGLSLYDCKLTEIPEGIEELINLKNLYLGNNQLTNLPEWIKELINLQKLDLSFNKLTSLPEGIRVLINLEVLDLSDNKLTSLPEGISELKNLQSLYLGYNGLTSLPEWIKELKKLRSEYYQGNQFTSQNINNVITEELFHPINHSKEEVESGYSLACLFLGCFWFFYKGLWTMAAIAFLLAFVLIIGLGFKIGVVLMLISWVFFAAFANELHRNNLLKQGYLTESQLAQKQPAENQVEPELSPAIQPRSQFIADELAKLAKLRESGILTEAEYNSQKQKLLSL
jgi:hypothetical protein